MKCLYKVRNTVERNDIVGRNDGLEPDFLGHVLEIVEHQGYHLGYIHVQLGRLDILYLQYDKLKTLDENHPDLWRYLVRVAKHYVVRYAFYLSEGTNTSANYFSSYLTFRYYLNSSMPFYGLI